MPRLLPHAHAVASGSDLLLLDVSRDAYSLLMDAVVPTGHGLPIRPIGAAITPEAASALAEAGLATMDDDVAGDADATPMEPPGDRFGPVRHAMLRLHPRDLLDLTLCVIEGRRRLRRGMAFARFTRERTTAAPDPIRLQHSLTALTAARLLVPAPDRCLPSSLVCALFLERRDVATEIVFGVRTHPFMAHCWVEAGGTLVDDEPERVAAYRPIAVAHA